MSKTEDNPFANIESDIRFEEFCRDLISRQSHLHNAKRIKNTGYNQYGGDVVADIKNSINTIVAQCKHYIKTPFAKNNIEGAVNHFLKSWDVFWKPKKVVEFYLIIAQPKSTDGQFEAIQNEKEKLFEYGITLIDWWQEDLEREIKKYPELVREYLGLYFFERFCPNEYAEMMAAKYSRPSSDKDTLEVLGLDTYKTVISDDLKLLIGPVREKVRNGKQLEAEKDFAELKEKHFALIKPDAQAELLSFDIRLFFPQRRTLEQAKETLAQIKKTDPAFQTTILEAIIANEEFGFEKALEKIKSTPDIQTLNLKLYFLLNLNKTAEFLQLYSAETNNLKYDTETKRLYSLCLTIERNITHATEIIDEAALEKPDWITIKLSRAVIYYLNGIPEQFINFNSLTHPIPYSITSLKADEISDDKRKTASKLFEEVLHSENLEEEQRLVIESWRLACLADTYDLQEEAIDYCKNVLAHNPIHPYVLLWAINRNFPLDYSESLKELENKFSNDPQNNSSTDINQCILLINLCLRERFITKAKRYLRTLKVLLASESQDDLYNYWKCQIEIRNKNEEKVFKKYALDLRNKQLSQDLQVLSLQNLVNRSPSRKNRRLLLNFLKKITNRAKNDLHLPLYAETCYRNRKFQEIVNITERLLKFANNLNLAIILVTAHYETNKFQACLDLIERFSFLYPNEKVPIKFQEYKAYSLFKTGKIIEADQEITTYFEKYKSPEAYETLFTIKKYTSDVSGIIKATKEIREHLDLIEPRAKFVIAQTIFSQDPEFAKELWREAKQQTLENAHQLISDAINLGFQFGLDEEVGDLFAKVHNLENPKAAGIKILNIDETIENYNKQTDEQRESNDLYFRGQLPLHFLGKKVDLTLSEIYGSIPARNAKEDVIFRKPKILTRNAARFRYNNQPFLSAAKPVLYLDISTLLLLDRLNLLERVEETANIYFSNKILYALESEIKALGDGQPKVTEQKQRLLDALGENLFETFEIDNQKIKSYKEQNPSLSKGIIDIDIATLNVAEEQGGIALLEMPIHNFQTNEEINISGKFPQAKNWTLVIKWFFDNSLLTLEEINKCQKLIESSNENSDALPLNSKLFFSETAFSNFLSLELLEKAKQYFQIHLNAETVKAAKARIEELRNRQKLSDQVRKLENKIKGKINSKYFLVSEEDLNPIPVTRGEKASLINDYRFQSVQDLIRLNKQELSFAGIDDRYFSGFPTINNQIIIIGVFEILEKLLFEKQISEAEYYQKLLQLRNENFRYLPITEKEVNYYLNLCSKENLETYGSQELKKLRQYLAGCFLDSDFLQKPSFPLPPGQNGLGELEFVIQSKRVFSQYISRIWKEENSIELAEAKTNFIFFNFYPSVFLIRHILPTYEIHKNGFFHSSWDIADLYLQGFTLIGAVDKNNEKPKGYFNWVNGLFVHQLKKNADLLKEVAKIISGIITNSNKEPFDQEVPTEIKISDVQKFTKSIYTILVTLLPDILQEEILKNNEFTDSLEIKPFSSISMGEYSFDCRDFYQGIKASLCNEESKVKVNSRDSEKKVVFSTVIQNNGVRHIDIKENDEIVFQLPETEFGIFMETESERFEFLSTRRNEFDCDESSSMSECRRIAAIEDPTERYFAVKEISDNSIEGAYLKLERQIRRTKSFGWQEISELPIQGLPKHFRLNLTDDNYADIPSYLENIAEQLTAEEGLEKAISKMARFPHKLPVKLIEAFNDLPLNERKELLEKFRLAWRSPLGKLHYFTLVLKCLNQDEEVLERAKKEAEYLLNSDEAKIEFRIFKATLQSIYQTIISSEPAENWTPAIKLLLTWAHTSKIFDLVLISQEKPEERKGLLQYIERSLFIPSYEIFNFNPILWADALHPRFLELSSFYGFASYCLFSEIPSELVEKIGLNKFLEKAVFNETHDLLFSHIIMAKDFSVRTNLTSSILFSRTLNDVSWLQTEKTIILALPETVEEYFIKVLDDLNQDYYDKDAWHYLNISAEGLCLKEPYRKKFIAVAEKIDIEKAWDKDPELAKIILFFILRQKDILPDGLKNKLLEWIKIMVYKLAEKYPYRPHQGITNKIEDWVYFVLEAAVILSIQLNNPLESSQSCNDLLFELGHMWNYLPVRLEAHFYRCWLNLPPEHNQNIGKNILLTRALK